MRCRLRTREISVWFCVRLPPVRSFSISFSREKGWLCEAVGPEALAAAAASWSEVMSRSSSPGFGVPSVVSSGAMTEMDWSLPGRSFSLPPIREGRVGWALPVEAESSGVPSESRRETVVDARGRFWPAVDLGRVADLGGAAACFWDFLDGASGWGHSTSWERSRRDGRIHSVEQSEGVFFQVGMMVQHTIQTLVELFVMHAGSVSEKTSNLDPIKTY